MHKDWLVRKDTLGQETLWHTDRMNTHLFCTIFNTLFIHKITAKKAITGSCSVHNLWEIGFYGFRIQIHLIWSWMLFLRRDGMKSICLRRNRNFKSRIEGITLQNYSSLINMINLGNVRNFLKGIMRWNEISYRMKW